MGVKGLTPFLQKKVPQVFKEIPNRLQGLKGKTIVVDGTLVTQRLHYSAMPHDYKHVLGWYRIVRQLRRSGVGVVCVFDGTERVLAKMRERERRQAVRNLAVARESIEVERVTRLEQLSKLLQSFQALPEITRRSALQNLKSQVQQAVPTLPEAEVDSLPPAHDIPTPPPKALDLQPASSVPPASVPPVSRPSDTAFRISYGRPVIVHRWVSPYGSLMPATPTPEADVKPSTVIETSEQPSPDASSEPLKEDVPVTIEEPEAPEDEPLPLAAYVDPQSAESYDAALLDEDMYAAADSTVLIDTLDVIHEKPTEHVASDDQLYWGLEELGLGAAETRALIASIDLERASEPVVPPADETAVVRAIATLYQDYCRSVPKFRIPARFEKQQANSAVEEATVASTEETAADGEDASEYAMSRYQYDLMLREGSLWDSVATGNTADTAHAARDASDTAHALHVRSAAIAASYAKRNALPTERTYEESRQMLKALGVPCLSSDGPHEGEAFAAALVHAGVADYVASEDTDVLIYEVPLLRGLTNLRQPLTAVSGTEVREALELSRASFVDFALLLGTDFSSRLRGLGPMRAIGLIKEHGSIEALLEHLPPYRRTEAMTPEERSDYLAQVQLARAVFQSLPNVSPADIAHAVMGEPDEARVRELLRIFGLERAAWEADRDDEPAGESIGFGASFFVEGGAGPRGRDIGKNLFQDAPAAEPVHAHAAL